MSIHYSIKITAITEYLDSENPSVVEHTSKSVLAQELSLGNYRDLRGISVRNGQFQESGNLTTDLETAIRWLKDTTNPLALQPFAALRYLVALRGFENRSSKSLHSYITVDISWA